MLGIRRREFITLLGSAAAWPIAARGQQRERMRRVGFILSGLPPDDPEGKSRETAFVQGLQALGWTDGRNVNIDFRYGLADPERLRKHAAELVMAAPDVLLAGGTPAAAVLRETTRNLPIVFANVGDPVGLGYVASLARPGGNITGFMSVEFSQSAKLLELLKQIAPAVSRVGVVRNPNVGVGIGQFAAIQTVAQSLGVELTPILGALNVRDANEMEHSITTFAHGPTDGLIVTSQSAQAERDLIIALAARHRLPAVYSFRRYVSEGGLISYGVDQAEPYRLAAGYIDRILKGEKPADLPVQAPTRYETVINLKTAKALGIEIPAIVLARADEVIE